MSAVTNSLSGISQKYQIVTVLLFCCSSLILGYLYSVTFGHLFVHRRWYSATYIRLPSDIYSFIVADTRLPIFGYLRTSIRSSSLILGYLYSVTFGHLFVHRRWYSATYIRLPSDIYSFIVADTRLPIFGYLRTSIRSSPLILGYLQISLRSSSLILGCIRTRSQYSCDVSW